MFVDELFSVSSSLLGSAVLLFPLETHGGDIAL
jgi:hypothetical protein